MLLQYLLLNDDFSRHIGLFTEWDYLAPPFWRQILRLELDLGFGLGLEIGLRLGLGLEFGTNDFLKTAEPKQRRQKVPYPQPNARAAFAKKKRDRAIILDHEIVRWDRV